jgi:type I restriction enzyme R subunit
MRSLIDMYIQADIAKKVSDFEEIGLMELIAKSGIVEAIATRLGGMRGSEAVAEAIENNVRRTIVREQLTDPAFFGQMSVLLDEIIRRRRAMAIDYQEYLRRIGELAVQVQRGTAADSPPALDTVGKRALYHNLLELLFPIRPGMVGEPRVSPGDESACLELVLRIDVDLKEARPDAWRGNQPKENIIKRTLWGHLKDDGQVERLFAIVKAQPEY